MAAWQVWLWGLAAGAGLMVVTWVASLVQKDTSLVDRVWGLAFVVLGWTYTLLGDGEDAREALVVVLLTVWGLRLSGYITWRNWGDGEDARYTAMRDRRPDVWWIRSLVTVFLLQAALAWLISLPLLAVATRTGDLGLVDVVAAAVFLTGFYFEAVGDWQLTRFLADDANRGTVMDQGLWRYTRHPNYFGDATVWWGLGIFGLATGLGAWWGLIGSALMTLFIVRVSGVALTEKNMSKGGSKRKGYDEYVARTNAFIPGRPRRD